MSCSVLKYKKLEGKSKDEIEENGKVGWKKRKEGSLFFLITRVVASRGVGEGLGMAWFPH